MIPHTAAVAKAHPPSKCHSKSASFSLHFHTLTSQEA